MNDINRKTKITASGSGGAHINWHMFGARGPLREGEGPGGGSANPNGGSGAGANQNGAGSGDPAGTPPSGGAKPVFTPEQQAEVNRIAARAREEGRQSATQTTNTAPKTNTNTSSSSTTDILSLRQEMNFKEAASDLGVPRDKRQDMFDLARAQGATDFGQWLESKRSLWSQPQTQQTQQTQQQQTTPNGAPTEAGKPPVASPTTPGNPVNPLTHGGVVDFWHFTSEQLDQLGPAGVRAEFEKHIQMAQRASGAPRVPTLPKR